LREMWARVQGSVLMNARQSGCRSTGALSV
jgi:hypothetical protein